MPDTISSLSVSSAVSIKLPLQIGHAKIFIKDSRIHFPLGYEKLIVLRISDKIIIKIPVNVTNV